MYNNEKTKFVLFLKYEFNNINSKFKYLLFLLQEKMLNLIKKVLNDQIYNIISS